MLTPIYSSYGRYQLTSLLTAFKTSPHRESAWQTGSPLPMFVLSGFSRVRLFAALWTVARQAPLVHGILQARMLEWVSIPFSGGSSQPRNQTHISYMYLHWQAGSFFFFFLIYLFNFTILPLAPQSVLAMPFQGSRASLESTGHGHPDTSILFLRGTLSN